MGRLASRETPAPGAANALPAPSRYLSHSLSLSRSISAVPGDPVTSSIREALGFLPAALEPPAPASAASAPEGPPETAACSPHWAKPRLVTLATVASSAARGLLGGIAAADRELEAAVGGGEGGLGRLSQGGGALLGSSGQLVGEEERAGRLQVALMPHRRQDLRLV